MQMDGHAQLRPSSLCVKACIHFFFVHVKSFYAIINRYRPTSFSCFSAVLGNHDVVLDLKVSTSVGSFSSNSRYLSFWEYTLREYPTPTQSPGNYAGPQ
jgi:hypothetical protein